MLPVEIQKQIFLSLPRICPINDVTISASVFGLCMFDSVLFSAADTPLSPKVSAVAWSDTANIPRMLEAAPVAVTLQLSADVRETAWTSAGMKESISYAPETQHTHLRQYRRVTLTLSVHARDAGATVAHDIINAYMTELQIWAMSDLRDIVDVAEDGGVTDLSYLEADVERREYSLYLRYALDTVKTNDNIIDVTLPTVTVRE